jgi:hypothetical protein
MRKGNYLIAVVFVLCYLITYPRMMLIHDEIGYFNRGLAFSQGMKGLSVEEYQTHSPIDFIYSPYPVGTPLFIGILIFVFGKHGVFLMGLLSILVSFLLMDRLLRKCSLPTFPALLIFCYLPAQLLSRTVMSEMPSLLIGAVFFYLFFKPSDSEKTAFPLSKSFVLAFIAGVSWLFRDTNPLLFALFLVVLCLDNYSLTWKPNWKGYMTVFLGGLFGIGIRLFSNLYFYGSLLFAKEPLNEFGLLNMGSNLVFYGVLILVFMPLGGIAIWKYRGAHKWALQGSCFLFLVLHLSYEYTGFGYSGLLKSAITGGRFLIPLLPLVCIALADYANINTALIKFYRLVPVSQIFTVGVILLSQFGGYWIERSHQKGVDMLYSKYQNKPIFYHHFTNANRYINFLNPALKGIRIEKLGDKNLVQHILNQDTLAYIFLSQRFENAEKRQKANADMELVSEVGRHFAVTKVDSVATIDGAVLLIFRLQK